MGKVSCSVRTVLQMDKAAGLAEFDNVSGQIRFTAATKTEFLGSTLGHYETKRWPYRVGQREANKPGRGRQLKVMMMLIRYGIG